eukprot:TRINITY_DN86_c0_g1_i1.p1 TRINITY_DN86_c0_g1~~TRINITY_DN86_c0_g1_i1.p1  ORF type:complete len:188 (-),score=46.96 TRINITY_DN86_c0_g1_i1:260-823(-)
MGLTFSTPISQLFWSVLGQRRECRIVMLGLDAAGKTTTLYRLRLGDVVTTIPTIGFNVESIDLNNGLSFTVWDIGGQDRIRPLWRHYYHNTQGIVFLVDSSDHDRVDEAREEIHKLLAEYELNRVPLLVYANKQDLPGAIPVSKLMDRLELTGVKDRHWHIAGCSAVTGDGLYEGMDWLSKTIKASR